MSFRAVMQVVFLILMALMPAVATAQQTGATAQGSVADPQNAVIPGATVTFTPVTGKALITQSQSDGSYVLHGVPAGSYSVTVTMPGFASFVKQGVRVAPGQVLTLNAQMLISEQKQEINVTAQNLQVSVDPDSNASATVIKGKDLDALSDDPDELSSELTALAGPAAGPSGGQIYVDGFTGGQLPPKSSIREIRINQNPFSAQFDKLGYGRVEVFTKPGTDKFHGNFSVQGGDNAFNTSNPFLGAANNQPPYYTTFLLGSISGPVTRSSSFTVGGSHRTIQDNNIVNPSGYYASSASSTTPCAPGDLTCSYFSTYPEADRAFPYPRTRSDVSPRVDFALGAKNTLTMRYEYYVQGTQNNGVGNTNLPLAGYDSTATDNTVQISDTQILNEKVINETRFEYERDGATQTPLSTTPTLSVQGILTTGGSSKGTLQSTDTHLEVQNYTSIALAKNFLRVGGRVRTDNESVFSNQGSNGTFTYSYLLDPCTDTTTPGITRPANCNAAPAPCSPVNAGISSYQCGLPGQYTVTTINQPTVAGRLTDVGLYAEDDWKPKGNLTFTLGLRYEAQTVINSAHDLAPRVAFAYGIPHGNKAPVTILRGGYGVFYDRFALADYLTTLQQNGNVQVKSVSINPGSNCTPANPGGCTGGTSRNAFQTYTLGPNLRSAYETQFAIGIDQQLGRNATMSAIYLNDRGVHQYLSRDFFDSSTYNYQFQSGGIYKENQIVINGNARVGTVSVFGFYSFNLANANTSGSGFFPTSNTNTVADYGRATFAHASFAVIGGSWQLPYGFSASPFILAQSGTPYNVTSGLDPSGSSIYNARPYFANGDSGNCRNKNDFNFVQTGDLTPVPINYCTGPANFTFNLRASRSFGFGPKIGGATEGGGGHGGGGFAALGRGGHGGGGHGGPRPASSGRRYSFTLGAQAFNIFNVVPYGTPTSSLSSTRFGQYTTLASGPFSSATAVRRITLQATFNF